MKIKFLSWGTMALAAATLTACSSDEPNGGNNNQEPSEANYMVIRLATVGGGTSRADSNYEDGLAAESKVKDIIFYFYDSSNNYWGKSDLITNITWNPNTQASDWTAGQQNITTTSNMVVVLHGLNSKAPSSVVAVVNAPTDLNLTGLSLKEAHALTTNVGLYNGDSNFVMSNSTYKSDNNPLNFATKVAEKQFLKEKPTYDQLADSTVVKIYVERLATKASLALDFKAKDDKTSAQTIASDGTITIGKLTVNGKDSTDVKITIDGWDVNQTATKSYLFKNVDSPSGTATDSWASTWWTTPASDFRSFWGKSANNTDKELKRLSILKKTDGVLTRNFTNATDGSPSPTPLYKMENMNLTLDGGMAQFLGTAPAILVSAHITSVTAGQTEPNWYRYQGHLYDETNFQNLVVAQFPGLQTRTVNGTDTTYTNLTFAAAFKITPTKNMQGHCSVTLKDEVKLYANDEKHTDKTTDVTIRLTAAFKDIEQFYQGNMYYNIPVKHLNDGVYKVEGAYNTSLPEGAYGMVRNHVYKLTINSIFNLGSPVNSDDPITPSDKEEYYIGAQVNILAWRIVSQNVDL